MVLDTEVNHMSFIKISATEPSSALRNVVEVKLILIDRYRDVDNIPQVIVLYIDGGPENRTNFLSVKISVIALQRSLNADIVLVLRTTPGYSYQNPPERENCILNIGLYEIGVMRKRMFENPEFERRLSQCSNIDEVCGLKARSRG